jgi:lipopolysaccharide transport system ATP-binding protein
MAEDVVIRAEGLGKKYMIGHAAERERYVALRDAIARGARNMWRNAANFIRGGVIVVGDRAEEFWALKDVNFEVNRGEVLGIIGRNGAGKSTLLKILSRITEPTEGRVTIEGRVASLLEVGTGFHPELTGRENVYLNGAILGMTRAEVRRKFDEIVAFAEVEKFLDTPVKRYSSGMYVRLAFAVAAHLEPEILIVDEVLAVGDAEFQRKCLGKMNEVSRREGRTILVVSHNMGVITSLCGEALWLDRRTVRERGVPQTVVGHYLARSAPSQDRLIQLGAYQRDPSIQDDRVRFTAFEWLCQLPLQHGEAVRARLHFAARVPVLGLSVAVGFNSIEGAPILSYHMALHQGPRRDLARAGMYSVDLNIDALTLGPSLYTLDIACCSGDLHFFDWIQSCVQLEVVAGPTTPTAIAQGCPGVRVEGKWAWNLNAIPYNASFARDKDDFLEH